jgi:FKBP-type peptidyl-prolyl cis-trans isomerase 2
MRVSAWIIALQMGVVPVLAGSESEISAGKKVTIEFSITLPESNEVIPRNVSQYVQGRKELLPALEQALVGMKPGETKRVELAADEAFGPYDEKRKRTVTRTELPQNLTPGTVLRDHEGQPFTVVQVTDNAAVLDYNHPLAGKRLVFDVKVLEVKPVS